jgi:hypothetical protein
MQLVTYQGRRYLERNRHRWRGAYRVLVERPEVRDHFGRSRHR